MAEDKDPLVDDDVDDDEEAGEEELPESPALADHSVETVLPRGVSYKRGPNGKLTEVPND